MTRRLCCLAAIALGMVAGLSAPARAQVAALVNGNLETVDPYLLTFSLERPNGWRIYNYTEYRTLGDGLTPTAIARSGQHSVRLPGGEGRTGGEFEGVHAEEQLQLDVPSSPRNWPQYTFNPPSGQPLTVSCWFNIPASDPMVKSRFGIKLGLLNGTNFGVFFAREWLDIDPEAMTAAPCCTILTVNTPEGPKLGIHTNGQWVKFTRTLTQAEINIPNPVDDPDWVPPTNPAKATMQALRFDIFPAGGTPAPISHGTVWVDDLRFRQGLPCPADFNDDGVLGVADIFAFLGAWFGGQCMADFNGTGGVNVSDIFAFLTAWFAGCP